MITTEMFPEVVSQVPAGATPSWLSDEFRRRFWAKTKTSRRWPGCRIWTGAVSGHGHGRVRIPGTRKNMIASRMAWLIYRGPIPVGKHVLHRCDNPPCVNVNHLFLGTLKDNTQDMMRKGRHRARPNSGEANHAAKLTRRLVEEIRSAVGRPPGRGCTSPVSYAALARQHGVSASLVGAVVRREVWR